jgi:hypothetical protein
MENIEHFIYYYDHNRSSESGPVELYCMDTYTVMGVGARKAGINYGFLSNMYCMCKYFHCSIGTVSGVPRLSQ